MTLKTRCILQPLLCVCRLKMCTQMPKRLIAEIAFHCLRPLIERSSESVCRNEKNILEPHKCLAMFCASNVDKWRVKNGGKPTSKYLYLVGN